MQAVASAYHASAGTQRFRFVPCKLLLRSRVANGFNSVKCLKHAPEAQARRVERRKFCVDALLGVRATDAGWRAYGFGVQ